MDHWIERQLRSQVTCDLKEFIPNNYFEGEKDKFILIGSIDETGFLSKELRWGYLAGTLGKKLYFDNELIMSARQKSASEVLMNLGMYVAAKSAHSSCTNLTNNAVRMHIEAGNSVKVARQLHEEHLPILEENITGALSQYVRHLKTEEASPFYSLLNKTDQIEHGFKKDIRSEIIKWLTEHIGQVAVSVLVVIILAALGLS